MDETRANRLLKKLSPRGDLVLLLDPRTKFWGVYQLPSGMILTPGYLQRPMKLWDCVDARGRFRLFDESDVSRVIGSTKLAVDFWKPGGVERLEQHIDKQGIAEQNEAAKRNDARQAYIAEETEKLKKGGKTIRMGA